MNASTVALSGALAYRFPALLPLLAEHLVDQEGQVLPHLFMADVERWIEDIVKDGNEGQEAAREVLQFLEEAFSAGDPEIEELISVSFLEHLPRPGEAGSGVRDMLGPKLSGQLRRIG